ncbi:MAG: [protein-PII] uridylyltransferase [Candidatus Acidiferrales bacterium]
MDSQATLSPDLRQLYAAETARIHDEFAANGDGRAALYARTALIDSIAIRLWQELISPDVDGPINFALVALGGYGRRWLFPHSDVDLLFLHNGKDADEEKLKPAIQRFSQEFWDLRLKISPATRSLSECDHFEPHNVEFAISLLDCRRICGDAKLFARLHDNLIPKLVARESQHIVKNLVDLTRMRHAKFGNTVFHLEPNVKDGPGGLRDYNVAAWLSLLAVIDKLRAWPDRNALLPVAARERMEAALDFLMSVRCFVHFRHQRDDNTLTWLAQEDAAIRKIGAPDGEIENPEDWMRIYFSHARLIHRVCAQLLEEIPTSWPSLPRQFEKIRARFSNAEFSAADGLLSLRQPSGIRDPEMLLRAFLFLAQHGLRFSTATEYQIEQALPSVAALPPRGAELWRFLQVMFLEPYAADALRAMQALRVLNLFLPELRGIEALVVRDYSHRFTVDEHTFTAIENLHLLNQSPSKWDQRYAALLDELERPELLYLAVLLHDTGKGARGQDHVAASVAIAEECLERLDLDPPDRETVLFLIRRHLEMSAALRRDIFEPETIRAFAEKVETQERLKMLCLLTHADVKAVNPEALTPWKAENIWQIYMATANYLNRTADERVHVEAGGENLAQLHNLAPRAGMKLKGFLEGMPLRYLRTHSPEEVLAHVAMADNLKQDPVQLDLRRGRNWYELTVVTPDRPLLFATMAGALAAWGMNIVKAGAFSNQAGTVVDTFYFTDRFRTLELNLPEWDRFKRSVSDVLRGNANLDRMLAERVRAEKKNPAKVHVATKITFDDSCSLHSTLIEVIAQDRPGLLHRIASRLANAAANIEIALIDTEGQMAIDVFYLTSAGAKLTPERQSRLSQILMEDLSKD